MRESDTMILVTKKTRRLMKQYALSEEMPMRDFVNVLWAVFTSENMQIMRQLTSVLDGETLMGISKATAITLRSALQRHGHRQTQWPIACLQCMTSWPITPEPSSG